jgi:hypothetical protein
MMTFGLEESVLVDRNKNVIRRDVLLVRKRAKQGNFIAPRLTFALTPVYKTVPVSPYGVINGVDRVVGAESLSWIDPPSPTPAPFRHSQRRVRQISEVN